jgi:hypothetical protein
VKVSPMRNTQVRRRKRLYLLPTTVVSSMMVFVWLRHIQIKARETYPPVERQDSSAASSASKVHLLDRIAAARTTVWLLCHGEVETIESGPILSQLGKKQSYVAAQELAAERRLKREQVRILCADLPSAQATAAIVGQELGCEPEIAEWLAVSGTDAHILGLEQLLKREVRRDTKRQLVIVTDPIATVLLANTPFLGDDHGVVHPIELNF